ncbi:MAG: hypothetical protein NC095_05210 [Muribaculum sp.]|nr:hypothetical protein [Muribaculum sp.]
MNYFIKLFLLAVAVVTAIPSYGVTDKEMEQARTMAAKHYLRYANNGSDYLDKLNPTSMSELTKSLKSKELDNIKSFNAVSVPKDYASWDKAKMVEYWSKTFFKSSGLKEDGKKCLGILAKNLGKIQVSAKAPASAPEKSAPETGQSAAPAADTDTNAPSEKPTSPDVAGVSDTPENPDTPEIPEVAEAQDSQVDVEEERPQKSSGTGWYVAILIILVGVVVWLVMYAQKSMKETGLVVADRKNSEKEIREAKKSAKEEVNKLREQYAASISAKNEEIKQLRDKCATLESKVQDLRKELERKADHRPAVSPAKNQVMGEPARQTVLPAVVYLGYVNARGLFVKASRSLNADSSVYIMDIPDGMHGTFKVVTDDSILDRLLSDPAQWLEGGCEIENPEDADIATEIVNITPGEAVFADNSCRVVKKALIKFI